LAPFERGAKSANGTVPYRIQQELQDMMQNLVGIVRTESEMKQALEGIQKLKIKAESVGVSGNREYNPGWHTALDLHNLLVVSEAIAKAGLERQESRGAHFRDDFPDKSEQFSKVNLVIKKGGDGQMMIQQVPIVPLNDEHKKIIEENK
jgi:succinate dehydrogenase / fumarate reductase flavoprotein subunit